MKIIGVTGGVGAGKSTVLGILRDTYQAQVLMADEIGRELMEPGAVCFQPIVDAFGGEIVKENGKLDRKKIADLVFEDREKLSLLNGIVHPAVRAAVEKRLADMRGEKVPLAVIESAILLEAGYGEICEEIWYIHADRETRIGRLMESRGYTREKCMEIMENQRTAPAYKKEADIWIENGRSLEETKEQIASFITL